MKYRRRPVVVDALQWDGSLSGVCGICAEFPAMATVSITTYEGSGIVTGWKIGTLEGPHEVSPGDFIIRGVKGEFYPCKPDIFPMIYEPED